MTSAAATSPRPRAASPIWVHTQGSAIHGRGVYARQTIPSGTWIVEYTGERITKPEAHRRELQRLKRQKRGEDSSVYIFDVNRRYDLDGRTGKNIARLINHSCLPNCTAETYRGHIWIVARREILEGEELSFDYGFPYKEWRLHPCRCGAKGCVGFIVNKGQRWRVRRLLRGRRKTTAPATSKS